MDSSFFDTYFTIDNIRNLLQDYRSLGPLPGILLPLLESFLPILPLILFVVANAAAYGFFFGSFLSWLGTCLGAVIVFWIFRKLSTKRFGRFVRKNQKIRSSLHWVDRHGFGPLFLLYCFPFTPSSLVNVASGLSEINFRSFLLAVALGKMMMIFVVSFVGYNWADLFQHPLKVLLVSVIVVILWVVGKVIENRLQRSRAKSQA